MAKLYDAETRQLRFELAAVVAERDRARAALTKIAAFASNRPPGQPWETYKRLALEGWPEALDIPR